MVSRFNRPRVYASLALWLLLTVAHQAQAADWPATIKQMERGGASKKQLAVAYNNYALTLSENGQWDEAESNLRRAVRLDPRNSSLKENLAMTLLQHAQQLSSARTTNGRRAQSEAVKLANEALRHKPKWPEAYVLIGDIEYAGQQLERAKLAWTKAKQLSPSASRIQDRLKRLNTESAVEQSFDKGGSAYFDLRYQNDIRSSTAFDLTSVLMQARNDIGRDFRYWPDRRIVVLIYSPESFAQIRRGPDWAAGIYDGKIRILYPESQSAFESVKPTLVHEYTHALVHDLARNQCPNWLNEGLAEYEEAKLRKPQLDLLHIAARTELLIPQHQLNAALRDSDPLTASLAYQQSYSLVTYMVEKYKFYRLQRTLEHLAAGDSWEVALKRELRVASDQLEKDYLQWLPGFLQHRTSQAN